MSNRTRFFMLLLLLLSLAGCASVPPTASWSAPALTPAAAKAMATDTMTFLRDTAGWSPAATTVYVEPAGPKQVKNPLAATLPLALRGAGYGVSIDPADAKARHLRYLVTPLAGGLLLRLQYDGTEASRLFKETTPGEWVATSPFTVREAAP